MEREARQRRAPTDEGAQRRWADSGRLGRQPRGRQRFGRLAEPLKAHRAAVADRPDVGQQVVQLDPADAAAERTPDDDDTPLAGIDEPLGLEAEVLPYLANAVERVRAADDSRLERVVGVHVLDLVGHPSVPGAT